MGNKETTPQISKRPLYSHEIRDAIKRAILNEELKPGDRVVETRWAKNLGVSQSPVREAIRELESMGLIENRPFQGAFVRVLDKQSIQDAYKVRAALEIVAIQTAAEQISDSQLEELSQLMDEMEHAGKARQFELFIEKDSLFHEKILEFAQNPLLTHLWHQCKIREYTRISTSVSKLSMEKLAKRHNMMFKALKKRDDDLCATAVKEHFKLLSDHLDDINPDELRFQA